MVKLQDYRSVPVHLTEDDIRANIELEAEENVRERIPKVEAKKQVVSIDFTLVLKWLDPHIRTDEEEINGEGILLSPTSIKEIWTPDLHIWNRTSSRNDQRVSMISSKILPSDEREELECLDDGEEKHTKTGIAIKYEVQATVFCKFEYSSYPIDEQQCTISFGSSSSGAVFVLNESNQQL